MNGATLDVAGGMSTTDAASSGTIDYMAGTSPNQPPPTDLTTLTTTSQNEANPAAALDTTTKATDLGQSELDKTIAGGNLSGGSPPDAPYGFGSTDPITGKPITDAVDPVTGKIVSMPGSDSSTGVLSSILKFAKDNPMVAYGALQTGGSFLSGLTNTQTPAQITALNAQAAANQAAANLTAQQTRNLAAPKAVAVSTPVTGSPQPLIPPMQVAPVGMPQIAGLINRPPPLAPITGSPT